MWVYVVIISLISLAALFYWYRSKNHNYWVKLGAPTASGAHWFFGNFKESVMGNKHFALASQDIYNDKPDTPYIGYIKFSEPSLLVKDPDLIKAILSTDFNSFEENDFKIDKEYDFLMGNNPFVLQGQEWRMTRGHASPLTTFAKLKMYYPAMLQVGGEMVKYIKNKSVDGGLVELETKKLAGMFTTDVVANAVFGVKNNTFENEDSLFAQVTKEIFASGFIDGLRIMIAFAFPSLGRYVGYRISSKKNEDILLSLTKKVMKERAQSGEVRNDIFQSMLTYRENDNLGVFTDKYIASHCYGFITDGYETSSDVLCFTLFELAWDSDVQDVLRSEIIELIAETKGEYTIEQVEKLKYLDMVVSESLRLNPPISVLSKICTSDYTFKQTKPLTIKKGTPITIPTYALHRDEKHYPNPEKFDPERFTEEGVAARHKFLYLPFGEGPRKCLGQRFGLLQVKIGLVSIIQNFRVIPSEKSKYPVQLDPKEFISRPLNGAWVQFENLNN